MIIDILTLVLTAAVLIVAVISLREQRSASIKQSGQLDRVGHDLGSLNERIKRVERELEPWEHLVPDVRIMSGNHQHYELVFHNQSAQEIEILEFVLAYNGTALSERARPSEGQTWLVGPQASRQIRHMFDRDPVGTLRLKEPDLPSGRCIEVEIALVLRLNGMERTARQKLWVTADVRNSTMTQYS